MGVTPDYLLGEELFHKHKDEDLSDFTVLDSRYLKLDASNDPITGQLLIQPATDTQNLILKHSAAGSTANIQEWQDSSGTLLSGTDRYGRIFSYGGSGINSNMFMNGGGNATLTGKYNVALGTFAGAAMTTAQYNILIGPATGASLTIGGTNVAIGYYAMPVMIEGGSNFALGFQTMNSATEGSANIGIGGQALYRGTNINHNVAIGYQSFFNNLTGSYNVGIGTSSGYSNTGSSNVFIGYQSGYYETGSNKLFIDNTTRTNEATARISAMIYGVFNATVASQTLTVNAGLSVNGYGRITGNADTQQLIVKANATQTANLQEWQNSSGTPLVSIGAGGHTTINTSSNGVALNVVGGTGGYNIFQATSNYSGSPGYGFAVDAAGQFAIYAGASTAGVTSKTAPSLYFTGTRWTGSASVNESFSFQPVRYDSGANRNAMWFRGSDGTVAMAIGGGGGQVTVGYNFPGSASLTTYGQFGVFSLATTTPTMTINAIANQTANLTEWKNSSGTVLNSIGLTGAVFNESGDASTDFRVESDTEANMIFLDANGDTDGAVYLGGSTNGIKINKGGNLTLLGTATVFDDLMPNAVSVGTGGGVPAFTAYNGNLKAYEFVGAALTKEIHAEFQLPHAYKEGSNIEPHIHLYVPNDATGGVIKFGCEYTWVNIDGTEGATATITGTVTIAAGAGNLHKMISFGSITGTGKTISSILSCRIYRDPADAADTFGASVWMKAADVHHERDKIGSFT